MLTYTRTQQKQAKVGETEDRISNLPDALLTRVLSFLSTKEAIVTGILSTRWKSIWTSIPTLDLSEEDLGFDDVSEEVMFRNFVDSALVGRKMPYLERVAISGPEFNPCVVESWISAAIERNIRNLELSLCYYEPTLVLCQSLFSCCTLVVLKLGMRAVLNFPVASTCFPNLKVLELSLVRFKDDDSARNLISSCPVLEDLDITTDEHKSFRTLNVTSRSLKTFSLDYSVEEGEFDDVPKILIDAPTLENIHITDNVTNVYEVKDSSSLAKAKLNVSNFESSIPSIYCAMRLFELLNKISNVKSLSVSSWTMQTLLGLDTRSLPIFPNLTSLKFYDYTDEYLDWKLIMAFLKSSPVLEVLIFEGFSFSRQARGNWVHDVPSCLVSHLKTIKISGFLGRYEAEKVSYFLKNAKVLEKMKIQIMVAAGELLILPSGSTTCKVEIC